MVDKMKTPCEVFVWYLLPGIRRELARCMCNEHKLTQAQAAEKLGVTEAAISQYLSKKRGKLPKDKKIKKEIENSAGQIVKGDKMTAIREICRICGLIKKSDMLPELYKTHTGVSITDCGFLTK